MCKSYCHVCGNENKKDKYFYTMGDIKIPICITCYEYIRIEIETFKWNLISRLREEAKLRKQQEAMINEFKTDQISTNQKVRETTSDNKDVKEKSPDNE